MNIYVKECGKFILKIYDCHWYWGTFTENLRFDIWLQLSFPHWKSVSSLENWPMNSKDDDGNTILVWNREGQHK